MALKRLAVVLEKGAKKYEARNWERGWPFGRTLQAILRHLHQYQEGMQDEDHLGHAMFGIMALVHMDEMIQRGRMPPELNDLPNYLPLLMEDDLKKAPDFIKPTEDSFGEHKNNPYWSNKR